ncbi:hypothetical protein [Pseudoxanthomonas koreensis]|uniref:hypothetical protein n=1 Tax=Pseudoxanthomonas koreensis TaxID=266061 RepID=UPI0013908CEF|nr:hypothetical protein [Pseudoxanthomonas koreensis]
MQSIPAYHHYRFGAHLVRTDVTLQALQPGEEGAAEGGVIEVVVVTPCENPLHVDTWLHHWHEDGGSACVLSLARCAEAYRLRFPGLCDFLIDLGATRITAEPRAGLSLDTFEHLLVDQVLPRLLAHRGELVIHASAVEIGTRTALFLGRSGWGKSTLAGMLHHAGHRLLSDDCALLGTENLDVTAVPTYPSLRLYGDSIGQTFGEGQATTSVAAYSRKRRVPVTQVGMSHPRPVHAIYLLNDPTVVAVEHAIVPLSSAAACMAIVEHSFRLDMRSASHTAALLGQAAEVLRRIPAFKLLYPRDYAGNGRLTGLLEQHIGTLQA